MSKFAGAPQSSADSFEIGRIDRARRFIPDHIAPLPHTQAFHLLSPAARLRYNQLVASCYHEHFIYLERLLANSILPALIERYSAEPIAEQLGSFQREERKHTAWFHALHQACEPALYRDNYYHFVRVPRGPEKILKRAPDGLIAFRFVFGSR